jgi:hypothetical protein
LLGNAVRTGDVRREERGVASCEDQAERRASELDIGQQIDAREGQCERDQVAAGAYCDGREDDHWDKLDRGDGAERKLIDCEIEDRVHCR